MEKVCLRVISFSCDMECFQRIKDAFLHICSALQISAMKFSELKPYWKIDGYGEIDIEFIFNHKTMESLKTLLSTNWENNVTDSRWAKIFCNDITFIGLSM